MVITEMRRPKKILHIITTAGIGGAELMLCRLLERNDPRHHQQAVLSLLTPDSLKERMESSAPLAEGSQTLASAV